MLIVFFNFYNIFYRLAAKGTRAIGQALVKTQYIRDCVAEQKLLNVDKYRLYLLGLHDNRSITLYWLIFELSVSCQYFYQISKVIRHVGTLLNFY